MKFQQIKKGELMDKKQEEIIQIIEDALEEKWLNLRDYDQEEAEEFEKAWNSIKIILKD